MNPYFLVIPILICIALFMLLLFLNLTYKFCKYRKTEKTKIHWILVITTIICFICGIFSVTFNTFHLWDCYHHVPRFNFKTCYIKSINSRVSDTFFYFGSLSLYLHLIYGRLKISLSGTYYSYSNRTLFCVSLPIYISIPCIIIYQLDHYFPPQDKPELVQKIGLKLQTLLM